MYVLESDLGQVQTFLPLPGHSMAFFRMFKNVEIPITIDWQKYVSKVINFLNFCALFLTKATLIS